MSALKFPEGFLWGTATAAHQVEGDNSNNDWWEWEQTPGHVKHGDKSTVACDWWHGERYRLDFDLARSTGIRAQRLSVEWSRLEPREGEWDENAFSFYRRLLASVREHDMVPLVTLHHFSNPRWLAAKGAWETGVIVPLFDRFAAKVVQELGDLCNFWVTINEPVIYAYAGYALGNWPPGKRNFRLAMRVLAIMLRGHAAAYNAIHTIQPNARVGIAHNLHCFRPANPRSSLNRVVVQLQDNIFNQLTLSALHDGSLRWPMGTDFVPGLKGSQDFVGLNFYFSTRVAVDWSKPNSLFGRQLKAEPWGVSYDQELDQWFGKGDIDPDAFYLMIKSLVRFGKPIFITENGMTDRNDELRPAYLIRYLAAMHRAIAEGAAVKGYFYWSLLDNFEWIEGYSLRFGLVHVDFSTQERTLKHSAQIYGRIAQMNEIPDDLLQQYAGD
jgi:beta-glucosidase